MTLCNLVIDHVSRKINFDDFFVFGVTFLNFFFRLKMIRAVQWQRSAASRMIIPINQITVIVMLPWKQKPDNRENYYFVNLFVFCA